jgi:hypothetical protein
MSSPKFKEQMIEPVMIPYVPAPQPEPAIDMSRFVLLGAIHLKPEELRSQLEEARTPEAQQQLRKRIVEVARAFSRNYKLKILPSEEKRWCLGIDQDAAAAVKDFDDGKRDTILNLEAGKFRPGAILYNIDDLALAPEKRLFARLRHEATRACESDLRYLFEGFKQAERRSQTGVPFGLLHTTCEEARIFQREAGSSTAALEALRTAMQDRLAEIRTRIDQQPLLEQFCLNLLYGFGLQGKPLPEIKDSRVIEASERVRPAFERYLLSNNQAANLKSVEQELWPEAQKLDELSVADELERQVAERLNQVAQIEHKFQKGMWTRTLNGLRRVVFMKPRRFKPPPEMNELFEISERCGGRLHRSALRENFAVQAADAALFARHCESGHCESAGLRQALDLARIESDRPAFRQILQALDPAERSRMEQQARAAIRGNQSELLKRQLPIGIDLKTEPETSQSHLELITPSPDEIQQQEERIKDLLRDIQPETNQSSAAAPEPDYQARGAAIRQELQHRELSRQGFNDQERELYESFKALERSLIHRLDRFLEELRPMLPKRRGYDFGTDLHYTGSRLNKTAVVRRAPIQDTQFWQRRVTVDSPAPCMFVTLLIDNSPSMNDRGKIEEARKTAIFWARALKELGIPFAIKYFGGRTFDLKSFQQDYDDPVCRIKPALISKLDASTGSTDIGQPLQRAETDMAAEQRRLRDFFGAVFVISDGEANCGLTGEALKNYISLLRKKYVVMNFMLASSPQELTAACYYFGERNVIAPQSFDRLPADSIRILRKVLREAAQKNGGIRYSYASGN